MTKRNFRELIENRWSEGKFVCVGLDSEYARIPFWAYGVKNPIAAFNQYIIDATGDIACAYKLNSAFYEAQGVNGLRALKKTIRYIHETSPHTPVIFDAKRADIGNTNSGYIEAAFDYFKADAITVHPYLGREALQPFLGRADKGIFVLCRTSNPGAGEFQDVDVITDVEDEKRWGLGIGDNLESWPLKLYRYVAYRVSREWNKSGNCGLVVGATYPEELRQIRQIVGDMPILIPGIGAQGGDIEKTVKAGQDSRGRGMIINSSRGIIFASSGPDFAEAARRETMKLHELVTKNL